MDRNVDWPDSTEPEAGPQVLPQPLAPSPPPSSRMRLRCDRGGDDEGVWTAHALPLRTVAGQFQYWPFSASDLYNWKTHNPSFSQDPQALTGLIESILLTHQPTWDDCQQLLQTLLTTEERQRVFLEARKNVPGEDDRPTQLPNEINEMFPLTRPDWDFNTAAGRERLRLYRQVLLAGLKGAGRRLTNLAKFAGAAASPTTHPETGVEALGRHLYSWELHSPTPLPDRLRSVREKTPIQDPRASLEGPIHCAADHPHGSKGRWHRCLDPCLPS
ncbi:uncharacterized protein LOC118576248 [Onychomys torridus]|uniref:uncharacterized protein LOC118576248 n=1 Tax=Onychomys torridus TaxID=38674 RepID=UPI00167F4EC9|nr:uncharacterized protein LOC118576248 [Onychomys torridus]